MHRVLIERWEIIILTISAEKYLKKVNEIIRNEWKSDYPRESFLNRVKNKDVSY